MRRDWTSDAARLAAIFTGFLAAASVPVALAADSAGQSSQATAVRAGGTSLEARANAATLELYALEAGLGRARTELEGLTVRRSSLEHEQALTHRQLVIARTALRVSETRLSELVRALYEQPGHASDPLAILLGAGSLEEALTGLDSLSRAAGENNRIVEQARTSRAKHAALDARVAARRAELNGLVAAAKARAEQLEAAAAERSRFISGLRRQQGLNTARIAAIEAQARSAEVRSAALSTPAVPATETPVEAADAHAEPVRSLAAGDMITVTSTGYTLRGRTATGIPTAPGVVAVDPSLIPLGTRLTIPGYGVGVAADTGGSVRGNVIDLWFPTRKQALAWGRRTVTIELG